MLRAAEDQFEEEIKKLLPEKSSSLSDLVNAFKKNRTLRTFLTDLARNLSETSPVELTDT